MNRVADNRVHDRLSKQQPFDVRIVHFIRGRIAAKGSIFARALLRFNTYGLSFNEKLSQSPTKFEARIESQIEAAA